MVREGGWIMGRIRPGILFEAVCALRLHGSVRVKSQLLRCARKLSPLCLTVLLNLAPPHVAPRTAER